ncbi:MAG TPA: class I SAM-dependent methyltransferase [Gaiellaceae bacterium]|jgi:SAM-dependent methyltransferase
MAFFSGADAYDNFMGRYSGRLAVDFADYAGVQGGYVLDVGAGTGALTAELLRRGCDVAAADPSDSFIAAMAERFPGVDVRVAPAAEMPYADGEFDAALAQLVVSFISDPVAGIREMARVTKPGGTVAACVWDVGGGRAPFSPVWTSAHSLGLPDGGEDKLLGTKAGQLEELSTQAGLEEVEGGEVSVRVEHATFDEWWEPFNHGVGPIGAYVASLDAEQKEALVEDVRGSFGNFTAVAWAAKGVVAS